MAKQPVPVFVRVLRGELQDNITVIYGETPKMYYIKIYSDGKYNNQQRRISTTNVTLAFVTNVAWIGWAIDNLKRAEFMMPFKERPQNLDEVYDSDKQSVPDSPVRVREEDEVSFTSADVGEAQRFEC